MHKSSNQGNIIVCKAYTAGWVWPGVPSHAQTRLELQGENLVAGGGLATLEVIQRQGLVEF